MHYLSSACSRVQTTAGQTWTGHNGKRKTLVLVGTGSRRCFTTLYPKKDDSVIRVLRLTFHIVIYCLLF